jgi:GST-like protein
LPTRPIPVDTRKGDQFKPAFLAVNPNGKVPGDRRRDVTVFDSNAILLYLAEKTGKFLPKPAGRGELLSWLMFVATGVGPFSGQACTSGILADGEDRLRPQPLPVRGRSATTASSTTAWQAKYMVGDTYTIVDMDVWGWARMVRSSWATTRGRSCRT